MAKSPYRIVLAAVAFSILAAAGCNSSSPPVPAPNTSDKSEAKPSNAKQAETKPAAKFKLGDMIDPFTPPSLEELEKSVEWVDMPVLDSMQILKEKLAGEKPLATVDEALKLKNDSPEANAKILSGLGQFPVDENAVDWDASINRHSSGDVNSTNPLLISSTIEFDVTGLTSFGLFGADYKFDNLASKDSVVSWQSSKDGLYDKVVMRDDLVWSDNEPITAHDVAYSFQVIMTKAVPVPAVRQGTNQLKWVEAYDNRTLVYFHKESLATNVQNINFPILPKHAYADTLEADPTMTLNKKHVALEDKPIVGGAYEIKSRTRGTEIMLERRESYYMHDGKQVRDKPYFKSVRFRIQPDDSTALLALKAGDVDEMILNQEQWQTGTNSEDFYRRNTKVSAVEWTEFHLLWNLKDPRFTDKNVRKAMSYAFDHQELLSKLLFDMCEPCTGPFHPTSKWASKPAPQPFSQDLDKAEQLLDEAGWGDSNNDGLRDKLIDGKRVDFEFSVVTSNRQDRIDHCMLLAESLDRIGIRCHVEPLEFAALVAKMSQHEFQAAYGGWGSGTDPDSTENIFGTGADRNYGQFSNPEVDKLFVEGRQELDLQKRIKIYQKISELLWEDQPYTWLYYRNAFYGFDKSLRGYYFSPRGPFNYGPGFSSIYKPEAQ